MDTTAPHKSNLVAISATKMVLCLIFLAMEGITGNASAQTPVQDSLQYWKLDTANDYFWDPDCPTPSSIFDGYNLWLLRQRMSVQAYQTIVNTEMNLDNRNITKVQFTNYMPLIGEDSFNSMIGTQYSKVDLQSDNQYNLNKSIQMVWLWTAWQYKYRRWNFNLTTETSFRGDENTLYAKTGNRLLPLLYIGYELNNRWDLILLGGSAHQEMAGQAKEQTLLGLQARYQPSAQLKILFGAPTVFAAEWTALSKTDIGMKFMYTTESLLFIRQRVADNVSIALQYYGSLNNSNATYFNNGTFNPDNSPVTFNNITYLQHQVFASVGLKLYKDIGFSIGAGYNPRSNMSLYDNNDKVYSGITSKDNIFVNCSLQFVRLK